MSETRLDALHAVRNTSTLELLASAFDHIPVAIVVTDRDGKIAMLNLQARHAFGYAPADILGKPVEILIPTRFRSAHPAYRSGFLAEPNARPMGAGRDLFALRSDGSEFPVEIGLNPIDTTQGTMVLSTIIDITERRRRQERFRQVVESAPNAMVMINPAGRIVMVNAQAESVFGYTRDELIGQAVESLVPERFREHHPSFRAGFMAESNARAMGAGRDLYARRKDGTEFPVEIGLNPIETDDGPMVLSAIVDITERKHREERLRQALQEKDLLLGEIHHRVKNNLQIVYSLLDLQGMQQDDPGVRTILQNSQNRIRAMSLIHQTLYQAHDFARVDFQFFLDALLPTLVESYAVNVDAITLEVSAHQVQLPIGTAIPCGLVVNELVTNALKHAFPDARRGRIRVELAYQQAGKAVLSVSNDGAPIPAELNLQRTTSLGLQLVHLLTRQLGGELEVERHPLTRFTMRFPFEEDQDHAS